MTASVLSFQRGQLRRVVATGDAALVLTAVERILSEPRETGGRKEALRALNDIWWVAAEFEELDAQMHRLDVLTRDHETTEGSAA